MRWFAAWLDGIDIRRWVFSLGVIAIALGAVGFLGRSSSSKPLKGVIAYDDDTSAGVKVFGRSGWFASIYTSPEIDCLPCFCIMQDDQEVAALGFAVTPEGVPYMQVRDPADGLVYHLNLIELAKAKGEWTP